MSGPVSRLVAIGLALAPVTVSAQAGAVDGPAAPASRATDPVEGLGVEFDINNERQDATLSWARKRTVGSIDANGTTARSAQTRFSASATVPVGGDDDLSDPQLLDKLSNGAKLTVAWSWFGFSGDDAGPAYRPGNGWQFGGQAALGYNRFDYRRPATLDARSAGRVQYSAGLFGALVPATGSSLLAASIDYQFAYKAQDETIVCKPVAPVPADDCVRAASGRPAKDDGLLLAIEYRRAFPLGPNAPVLAMSPRVTVDALDGTVGVELPVYLLPSGKSPVLPGIRIGYASDRSKMFLGVFLKTSFGLTR